MCGICGLVSYTKGNNYISQDIIRRMCRRMVHRGPDDEGIYVDHKGASVGLGHRRLSIIDLSSVGRQPMANEDGSIRVVFNGEIYNYRDLKRGLIEKGHIFISNTDTETVIHLYEEYGRDCVKYLRGMFAFAIWDTNKHILFLSRDRVGKKPLLYSYTNGIFSFASEFLSLLESGLIKKEINRYAIDYYLTYGYIPAPFTIYNDVFKLLPAHSLILSDKGVALEKYWNLDYSPKKNISEEEAKVETLNLLKEATKIRLYSDVPLGAFLSGGIDSSTIVYLMSQLSGQRVKTFSIGFEDSDYSELKYARNIANKFNTEHNEFIVKPKALEVLPLLVERYGEPYADSSCIPTYYVARETKRFVTVALNGDGGDELFAGYERYQAMLAAEIYQKMPLPLIKVLSLLTNVLPDSAEPRNRMRRIRRFLEGAILPTEQRYIRWVGIFDDVLKGRVYSEGFQSSISKSEALNFMRPFFNKENAASLIDRLLYADTMTYLPNDLLVKVDISSMANSLEARSPFLDHKLMEFAASLPASYKMRGFIKKHILKKAIDNVIPKENIYRRKMGFGAPVGRWFRNELKGLLQETLLSEKFRKRGYFNPGAIEDMVKQHISGEKDFTFQLWSLLMLELWHRRFID